MKLIEKQQQKQRIKSLKSWTLAALGFLLAVSRFMLHFVENAEERKEERGK